MAEGWRKQEPCTSAPLSVMECPNIMDGGDIDIGGIINFELHGGGGGEAWIIINSEQYSRQQYSGIRDDHLDIFQNHF